MNCNKFDLPKKLPPGTPFEKLTGQGEPYRCVYWKPDKKGVFCMYYKVSSQRKRLPLSEIIAAMCSFKSKKYFDRKAYKCLCPISNKDGPCGFAVMGGILKQLADAKYAGYRSGRFVVS